MSKTSFISIKKDHKNHLEEQLLYARLFLRLHMNWKENIAELLQNFIGSRSRKIFGLVVLNHFTNNSIHFFYKVI